MFRKMINKIMQKYVLSQNTRWEENTNTKLPFTYNQICIKILYMYIKYKYKKQCSPHLFSRYKIKMTPCFHYFLFIFVLCPKIIYMLLILINSRKKQKQCNHHIDQKTITEIIIVFQKMSKHHYKSYREFQKHNC